LTSLVKTTMASGCDLSDMVKKPTKLPSLEAIAFRSMKAHGMHLKIRSREEEKTTSDSSIAATFLQPKKGTKEDANPSFIPMDYIG
jgi:hypothetical protein